MVDEGGEELTKLLAAKRSKDFLSELVCPTSCELEKGEKHQSDVAHQSFMKASWPEADHPAAAL